MLNIKQLSHAVIFSEIEHNNWAESETEWNTILPSVESFNDRELLTLFSNSHQLSVDKLRSMLSDNLLIQVELFVPIENYFFSLDDLEHSPEQAQTILYKAKSPCRIVEFIEQPVLTCPGDVWAMSDVIAKAFLLLGYIPPFIIQEPFVRANLGQNVLDKCKHYIQAQLNSLIYESELIAKLVT